MDGSKGIVVTDFNPRSPWGERLIHQRSKQSLSAFQSTLPVGGATRLRASTGWTGKISIHAPRGGSDKISSESSKEIEDFNPRSPWGERRPQFLIKEDFRGFQSTLPVGGATVSAEQVPSAPADFNPRSPWGERPLWYGFSYCLQYFNPRSPWGERQSVSSDVHADFVFQSTLPVGGATFVSDKE